MTDAMALANEIENCTSIEICSYEPLKNNRVFRNLGIAEEKMIVAALRAQPEYLSGCLHPGNEPKSCQYEGGCQSEACDHYGKTEYRPRMTLLARDPNVLYPKVET